MVDVFSKTCALLDAEQHVADVVQLINSVSDCSLRRLCMKCQLNIRNITSTLTIILPQSSRLSYERWWSAANWVSNSWCADITAICFHPWEMRLSGSGIRHQNQSQSFWTSCWISWVKTVGVQLRGIVERKLLKCFYLIQTLPSVQQHVHTLTKVSVYQNLFMNFYWHLVEHCGNVNLKHRRCVKLPGPVLYSELVCLLVLSVSRP